MLGIFLIVLCAGLWATDALFRMPIARQLDAGTIVLLEHIVGTLATLPWFFVRRRELRSMRSRDWLAIIFVGTMGSGAATYFFTASYRFVNPSVTILLQKLQPVIAVGGARIFLGETPRRDFYLWGLVAIVGAALVSLPEHLGSAGPQELSRLTIGSGLALSAAACWGLGTVFGKFVTARISFPVTASLRFVFGLTAIAALVAAGLLPAHRPPEFTAAMGRSIAYMALVPGVLAMYLYYAGLKRTRASVATFAELFFPVAAVIINWTVLGQALGAAQIAGMGLLLVSVFFIGNGMR